MSTPRRTCALTRIEADRDDLVRLVCAPDGTVVVDYRGRLPGRGVWITPTAEVLAMLPKRGGAVAKALGGATVDAEAIVSSLRDHVQRGVADGISMAAAGGALVRGRERLMSALMQERVRFVATASDAAPRTLDALQGAAGEEVTFVAVPWTAAELGARIGRGPIAAVGATSARPAAHLRRQLRRLQWLG